MGWLDHQEQAAAMSGPEKKGSGPRIVNVKLPGGSDFIQINKNVVKRVYEDDLGGPLLIIVDEAAELLMKTKVKSEEGKEEDALKSEIESIIQSITQLGRSAGIHCLVCTQRNDSSIISGVIQNNCLASDTKVLVEN
jgi:DNA helicase HerA-like ATPase